VKLEKIDWYQWRIQKMDLGEAKRLRVVPPAGVQGQSSRWMSGGKAHRSWSINAFCVIVKPFSCIPKCKN